jgi:hypothetical protein
MLVARRPVLIALTGRPAARAPLVFAVATMSSMAEHVHGDEGDGDQYPDPVC